MEVLNFRFLSRLKGDNSKKKKKTPTGGQYCYLYINMQINLNKIGIGVCLVSEDTHTYKADQSNMYCKQKIVSEQTLGFLKNKENGENKTKEEQNKEQS